MSSEVKNIKELEKRAKLTGSDDYKELRKIELEKIISLAKSDIEPLELKGMLRLVAYTDSFEDEYNKKLKNKN